MKWWWCNEAAAEKGIEFGNSETKMLPQLLDFFGLCHRANTDVKYDTENYSDFSGCNLCGLGIETAD